MTILHKLPSWLKMWRRRYPSRTLVLAEDLKMHGPSGVLPVTASYSHKFSYFHNHWPWHIF